MSGMSFLHDSKKVFFEIKLLSSKRLFIRLYSQLRKKREVVPVQCDELSVSSLDDVEVSTIVMDTDSNTNQYK